MVAQPSGIVFPTFKGMSLNFCSASTRNKNRHQHRIETRLFHGGSNHAGFIDGSSEVKFPTTWTDEKQRWESQRREEKRRDETTRRREETERRGEERRGEERRGEERRGEGRGGGRGREG